MEAERSREVPVTWGGISHSYPPAFSNRDSKRDAWAEVAHNFCFLLFSAFEKVNKKLRGKAQEEEGKTGKESTLQAFAFPQKTRKDESDFLTKEQAKTPKAREECERK